jgi:4-hydroxybenzoate polyprenyltransferase
VSTLTFGIGSFQHFKNALLYAICSFFATLFVYNLQRLMRFEDVKHQASLRHKWLVQHKKALILLSLTGLVGAAFTYLILGIDNDFILLAVLTIIGFLYAFRIKGTSAVREIPFLKIYLIATVWSLVTVFWSSYREETLNMDTLYLIISVGLYIVAATIPFDVRDLLYDHPKQKTIPQLAGINGSKWIGITLLLISAFLLFSVAPAFIKNPLTYLTYLGMGALILFTNKSRQEMYFSGLIDGWIIIFGLQFLL